MKIPQGRRPLGSLRLTMRLAAIALLAALSIGSAMANGAASHVLLTNDDGYEAAGIKAMHEALLAAGYRVTVVAPRDQQSGSSMRVTIGSIVVEKLDDALWIVAGTPADSVAFALQKVLQDDPPDIVVSGVNFGQNLGSNTNLSGTVGAAIMAAQLGVPAIAVSVGIDLAERDAKPVRFPSTMAAFAPAAALSVDLLRVLEQTRGADGALLPANRLLNVNYPALPVDRVKGLRLSRTARVGGFVASFVETDTAGEYRIALRHGAVEDRATPMPDTSLFAAGFATVSVLDSSLDAGTDPTSEVTDRLQSLLDGSASARPGD